MTDGRSAAPGPRAPTPTPSTADRPPGAATRPIPFRQFVLKLHSRCNLACSYCYIYTGADSSWHRRPPRIEPRTLLRTAGRIAEHAASHHLREIHVDLHGGEPLLSGPGLLLGCVDAVRAAVAREAPECTVHFAAQTNGTLLTARGVDTLADAGLRIGISLDGGLAGHNRRRVDHAGRPAHAAVVRGLELLRRRPDAYAGILTTIDPTTDPDEVYASLLAFEPPALDLLLPHANWNTPPPGIDPSDLDPSAGPGGRPTPYGDWLATVFDRWFDGRHARTRIRLFAELIGLLLGIPSTTEALGLSPFAAVVIDTDGEVEQVDSLKTAYEGAPATGLDVFRNSFDEALDHPGVAARRLGAAALGPTCHSCPVLRVCGGGNYTHRYRAGHGFRNPSVHCADLDRLIRHAATRLRAALPAPSADTERTRRIVT